MRKLSASSALSEARRFKTLTMGRTVGGGAGGVAMPQPTAQNQMVIASAAPAWALLAAPTAEGQVPVTGADPYTPAWGTTFPAVIQFDAGLTFGGATGVNVVTVPDSLLQAMHIVDTGGTEYLRIKTTDPAIVINEGGADMDFRVEADTTANALFVRGSDGYVGIAYVPEAPFHVHYLARFDAGITLAGATSVNVITMPDNLAQAINLVDAGGIEYLRVVTTNAQPVVVFNEAGADVDHRWEASGVANALFIRGSDGNVYITESSATVRLSGTKEFAWTLFYPGVATYSQIRIPWDCTVIRVDGNTLGGTSCTLNIEERATLGSALNDILSSDMVADADGESVTSSFNDSSLAGGNYLTIDVSAVSGTVREANIMVTVTLT